MYHGVEEEIFIGKRKAYTLETLCNGHRQKPDKIKWYNEYEDERNDAMQKRHKSLAAHANALVQEKKNRKELQHKQGSVTKVLITSEYSAFRGQIGVLKSCDRKRGIARIVINNKQTIQIGIGRFEILK